MTVHKRPVCAVLLWAAVLPTFGSTPDSLQNLLPSRPPSSLQLLCVMVQLLNDIQHTLFLCSSFSAAKSLRAALLTDLGLCFPFPPVTIVPTGDLYKLR